jgi:hypothetical protein
MTALNKAAFAYRTIGGTSTVYPPYNLFDYIFRTVVSTTLSEERVLSEDAIIAIGKMRSYLRLGENWDSYGGVPPQKTVVDRAISLVISLDRRGYPIFFTAPGPNGEILVELKVGEKTIETTFNNESEDSFAFFQRNQCVREDLFSEEKLPSLLQWLQEV